MSLNYTNFLKSSTELEELLSKSQSQIEQAKKSLNYYFSILNNKINEATVTIDDMKFISDRAEKLMDTLNHFIKLDNNIKRFFHDINIKKTQTPQENESFDRVLNFVAKKHSVSTINKTPIKLKNLILKISETCDK